jgi:ribulose-phosphate 3-epimerase
LFDLRQGDIVSVHAESTVHVHRALSMVRERGAAAALALNPATPIETVRELLPDIGMVLLMTVNPGYAGQKLVIS